MTAFERHRRRNGRQLLALFDRANLRRAMWLLRREHARPSEPNAPAAQYDSAGITVGMVRAEYRRRGWKVPKATRGELP